jgi:hypothetical protein
MLLKVVATFHFANEAWIFVNSVFTARRPTPTMGLASITSVLTTKTGLDTSQPIPCQMMVLQLTMVLFYFHLFMNRIGTLLFTIPTLIPLISKPTARMRFSMQCNLQFGHIFMVLHTWTPG